MIGMEVRDQVMADVFQAPAEFAETDLGTFPAIQQDEISAVSQ
jgi:hypothetical protein